MEQHSENIVKTSEVINVEVKNNDREKLGKIEDIMLDKLEGAVRYVVLSFGGIMGLGDKLFALPWKSISYEPEEQCFILNISKERLQNAPGFNKDAWPDMAEPEWQELIKSYYNQM